MNFTKEEKSWMMYDFANSAQSVIIVTLLPIFYQTINSANPIVSSYWGYSTSVAMLIIAILSPILGALGDYEGYKKKILTIFMMLGVTSCLFVSLTPLLDYNQHLKEISIAIILLYILCQIGFSGANIMYDSLLPDVTTDERMDKVSIIGFGLGYIGGSTVPLVIFLILSMFIPMDIALAIVFFIAGIWWFVFSLPILKNVKQKNYVQKRKKLILDTFLNLAVTFKEIVANKVMFVFLLAYFFYIDGVNTIIHMSTIYGSTLGIDATQMMLALLLTQILGLPFAILYTKLAEKFGSRAMIRVGIIVYIFICIFGYNVKTSADFWFLAFLIGTSQGGIQALSRSYFGKIIPDKKRSGEFFGVYDIFGKFSAIMGPMLYAFTSSSYSNYLINEAGLSIDSMTTEQALEITKQSSPIGVLSVLLIFIIGGVLFTFVLPKYEKKEQNG
ncbi:MAG: MFS transporter [Clostridia bacterium]